MPYTGIILSTREASDFRGEVIAVGVSQISAGSCTGVGGYAGSAKLECDASLIQFEPEDHRPPMEVLKELLRDGYVPSYCTACYREGRTGDRFMSLAKSGQIANICQANALLTLQEYLEDYGDYELKELGDLVAQREIDAMPDKNARKITLEMLSRIKGGERDLRH